MVPLSSLNIAISKREKWVIEVHGWIESSCCLSPQSLTKISSSHPPQVLPFPQENTLVWEPPPTTSTLFSGIKLVPRTTCAGLDRKPKSKGRVYDGSLTRGFSSFMKPCAGSLKKFQQPNTRSSLILWIFQNTNTRGSLILRFFEKSQMRRLFSNSKNHQH